MIDWQRVLDSPAFFAVAVGVALLVGGIAGSGLTFAFRKMTAQDVARKWFGEIQRQVVIMASQISQLTMSGEEKDRKVAVARGIFQTGLDELEDRR